MAIHPTIKIMGFLAIRFMNNNRRMYVAILMSYTAGFALGFYNAVKYRDLFIVFIDYAWFVLFFSIATIFLFRRRAKRWKG